MVPSTIGRYEIKSELGRGGMATVYHGHDPYFQREVAVKVLPREFLHDETFRARFEREARTVARLDHPGIVPVYDFGEDDGQPYLVMRYLPGGSLTDRLKNGPLPLQEVARLLKQIAPALDEAHHRGIIHRDLKPDNILFDLRHQPFITDFGIVKLSEGSEMLTTTTTIIGTPAYMSPEQAHGEVALDGRSDIYALGVLLFHMLTGQLPFQANTPIGLIMKHLSDPVPSILRVKPELPFGCEDVIMRAMAKEREERYDTVRTLATALVESITAKPGEQSRPVARSSGSRPADAAGVACPKCGAENPNDRRLCAHCGQRLQIECMQCYAPNRYDATVCEQCGADIVRSRALRHAYQRARKRTITERSLAVRDKEVRQLSEQIEELLADLEDRHRRERAYRQLNQFKDRQLRLLTDALGSDQSDEETRSELAQLMGRLCEQQKVKALVRSQLAKALIKALEDPASEVRYWAAEALGKLRGPLGQVAVEPLGAALNDQDRAVQTQARRSLQKIGGKRAQEILDDQPKGFLGWIKRI